MLISDRPITAALATLVVLQLIMLTALYAGVPPHPPAAIPLFGMAPFLGAAISTAIAAMVTGPNTGRAGRGLSGFAALLALVSFGPQKYFDAQIGLIWPAVVTGQLAAIVILTQIGRAARRQIAAAANGFPATESGAGKVA
ncbi:hypothetical protein SAMN05421688_1066 [Poseidonocella pacifica]|uniref:Uncharacterized protein n=1 Tax=Poseidonocella pacifica TaxID=871651 RepID=A0A1I0VWE1_9RHOB|nr:hypothetical protein [Poseidonocella pacifica]SFA80755.1 hypothetical protein SAMN05421688_1066 [Poseidonocella pacifica]